MAKITRKHQKVFAGSKEATPTDFIAEFGSKKAGTPSYSADPDTIQGLAAYDNGFGDAIIGNNVPYIQDMNALHFLTTRQIAYLMQTGVAEWLTTTVYYIGSIVNDGTGQLYYSKTDNNTGNNPTTDSGTNWAKIAGGSGGSGGINYVTQNTFEDGIFNNWTTYKDAAAATPADGTGGSPTTVTLSVVADTFSGSTKVLELSKSAANGQGEGLNFGLVAGFDIAEVDRNKVLSLVFDAKTSANYASGDMVFYIYDVTNSLLITPTATSLVAGTSRFYAEWVAAAGSKYRLIGHIATTNATAYTVHIDNVSIGPGLLVSGAAIGPWTSYTPTFTGFGTPTISVAEFRRVGSDIDLNIKFTSGTTTATTARITLPNGYTVSASGTEIAGRWWRDTASAATRKMGSVTITSGASEINFGSDDNAAAASPYVSQDASAIISSAQVVWLRARVKVNELSTNAYYGNEQVIYASSTTGTWDADAAVGNTVIGQAGSPISGSLTSDRTKVLRLPFSLQPSQTPILQYRIAGTNTWIDQCDSVRPYSIHSGVSFGGRINSTGTSGTDITVIFNQYAQAGTTYNTTTGATNWSSSVFDAWRVKVVSGAALSGFNVARATTVGLAPAGIFDGTDIDLQPRSTTPADPASSSDGKIYLKSGKLVLQYNDAGTVRYKYLDLTGTGVTWVHTTSAP